MALSVRPKIYRDRPGFVVGGRPKHEKSGFPISIFVRCRSTAMRIKKLYNVPLPNPHETGWAKHDAAFDARSRKLDTLMRADSRVKICKR